jgi:type IV pilus assembly protein PilC
MTRIISQVSADIMGGMPLAEALRKFPATFDTLYCNMIAAGEASGKLDETLTQLARHLEKASATKHRIAAAMAYPAAVACITIAATALMFGLVVPKFASMFLELGGALPLPTRIVMDISTGSRTWFLPGFLAVLVLIFLTDKWRKSSGGALPFEKILLAIPATGKLRQKSAVARFARTLATLLASGVGILQALSIAATASGNAVLNKGILVALEHIAGGQSIAGPLEESGFFPPMVVHMVAVGEKTGDLSGMFHRIAAIYDEEVETAVRTFTSMLEPLLLVLMAVIIGTILIAMYLPMFELMSTIQ